MNDVAKKRTRRMVTRSESGCECNDDARSSYYYLIRSLLYRLVLATKTSLFCFYSFFRHTREALTDINLSLLRVRGLHTPAILPYY